MLSFVGGWAQHIGMHDWSDFRPQPEQEIIIMSICMTPKVLSWKSIEAARGFYTTWTEGPMVAGTPLGLKARKLPIEARTAFLEAQVNHKVPVVLVNPLIEYAGQIRSGVIDADALTECWWIGVDELAARPIPAGSFFDLKRSRTRASIQWMNQVYHIDEGDIPPVNFLLPKSVPSA